MNRKGVSNISIAVTAFVAVLIVLSSVSYGYYLTNSDLASLSSQNSSLNGQIANLNGQIQGLNQQVASLQQKTTTESSASSSNGVRLPCFTSDPSPLPAAGTEWCRSDLGVVRMSVGTAAITVGPYLPSYSYVACPAGEYAYGNSSSGLTCGSFSPNGGYSYLIVTKTISSTQYYYAYNSTGYLIYGGPGNVGRAKGTSAGSVIQSALTAGAPNNAIQFGPGIYTITQNISIGGYDNGVYGTLIMSGAGQEGAEGYSPPASGGSTLYFNQVNLQDAMHNSWVGSGYGELLLNDIGLVFKGTTTGGGGAGAGMLKVYTMVPLFRDVSIAFTGNYVANSILMFGWASGPTGITGQFYNVKLDLLWTGSHITAMQGHFDSFYWNGGSILTDFGSGSALPSVCVCDPVGQGVVSDISVFRADSKPMEPWYLGGNWVFDSLATLAPIADGNYDLMSMAGSTPIVTLINEVYGSSFAPVTVQPGILFSNGGEATFSGTGSQTIFSIPHGLQTATEEGQTNPIFCQAQNDVASLPSISYIAWGPKYLSVIYSSAPSAGTNNVVIAWSCSL
jgi:hypothetical protein